MKPAKSVFTGAAFLMATSAIGPGFLTTTTLFTAKLMASFGFTILVATVIDIIAQANIWRIITVANKPAQAIANQVTPGLGTVLSALIIGGGMVFNIGNIAGCGLGLQVLFGIDVITGSCLSAGLAMVLFSARDAGKAIDVFTRMLGLLMIVLMVYVAVTSSPPVGKAIYRTFVPEVVDVMSVITIVGGTVGGYITFAGAHRLLEAGVTGRENLPQVHKSTIKGIAIVTLMRLLLFIAALGVVSKGLVLDKSNPAASVFELAAGRVGYILFGLVIWAAAITSVVGASFTSVSFARELIPDYQNRKNYWVIGFIALAALLFALYGKPVKVLVFAGALNGFILAFAMVIMMAATRKPDILAGYRYPVLWFVLGIVISVVLVVFGCMAIYPELTKIYRG